MAVTAVHITFDGLECANSRSDGQMLTRQYTSHSSQTNDHDSKLPSFRLFASQLTIHCLRLRSICYKY
ncbi:MAG: hypothetical protein EZS28_042128 [Streblomastix strix]|uniref:Uncharacterized protein n=1 Tax=Streblomastix strix TaxID=222440 RepID=A0A5J4TY57_9EUKA|nr:MAG: hypothetical protein EZS28_042128 [Streblomastix strix]